MSVLKLLIMMSSIQFLEITNIKFFQKNIWGNLCLAGAISPALVHPCDHLAARQAH